MHQHDSFRLKFLRKFHAFRVGQCFLYFSFGGRHNIELDIRLSGTLCVCFLVQLAVLKKKTMCARHCVRKRKRREVTLLRIPDINYDQRDDLLSSSLIVILITFFKSHMILKWRLKSFYHPNRGKNVHSKWW